MSRKAISETASPAPPYPRADPPASGVSLRHGPPRNELELQVAETVRLSDDMSEARKDDRMGTVVTMMRRLAPGDDVDVILAAQMVACHHAVMDCLHRATGSWQTREGRDMELRHAARLMNVYARQSEALDRRRAGARGTRTGTGTGAVTVERVNVAAGGQAVVGHVETGGGGGRR
jgi:hypothetical protein